MKSICEKSISNMLLTKCINRVPIFFSAGTMKTKSTRSKAWSGGLCKGQSGGAWNDPEQLSLKVLMALVYMAGLVAFQRYTGLLNPSPSSTAISKTQQFSSQDALYWLKHYHPVTHG